MSLSLTKMLRSLIGILRKGQKFRIRKHSWRDNLVDHSLPLSYIDKNVCLYYSYGFGKNAEEHIYFGEYSEIKNRDLGHCDNEFLREEWGLVDPKLGNHLSTYDHHINRNVDHSCRIDIYKSWRAEMVQLICSVSECGRKLVYDGGRVVASGCRLGWKRHMSNNRDIYAITVLTKLVNQWRHGSLEGLDGA